MGSTWVKVSKRQFSTPSISCLLNTCLNLPMLWYLFLGMCVVSGSRQREEADAVPAKIPERLRMCKSNIRTAVKESEKVEAGTEKKKIEEEKKAAEKAKAEKESQAAAHEAAAKLKELSDAVRAQEASAANLIQSDKEYVDAVTRKNAATDAYQAALADHNTMTAHAHAEKEKMK